MIFQLCGEVGWIYFVEYKKLKHAIVECTRHIFANRDQSASNKVYDWSVISASHEKYGTTHSDGCDDKNLDQMDAYQRLMPGSVGGSAGSFGTMTIWIIKQQ